MSTLAGQTYAFLITILAGGIIGLLFDIYRAMRSVFRPGQLGTALWDIIFWLMITPVLFASLLASNWGELRFYVVVGLGLGLLLYFQALSPWVIWIVIRSIRSVGYAMGQVFQMVAKIVTFPLVITGVWDRVRRSDYRRRFRPRPKEAWRRFSLKGIFGRPG